MKVPELFMVYWFWGWAASLWLPGETFNTSSSYGVLKMAFPEYVWGFIAFMIGFVHFSSLANNRVGLRILALNCGTTFWIIITLTFAFGNPIGTAHFTYLGIAALSNWLKVQVVKENSVVAKGGYRV